MVQRKTLRIKCVGRRFWREAWMHRTAQEQIPVVVGSSPKSSLMQKKSIVAVPIYIR